MRNMATEWGEFAAPSAYERQPNLILINGLAEQAESWFSNRAYWARHFDVKAPELVVYDGPVVQRRIAQGLPITVDFLADQLRVYLDHFVQAPPYHLVASSLGCQVAIEYAARYPQNVGKLVLICPSGMGGEERLPIVEGVRHNDLHGVVASVFADPAFADTSIVQHYERQFVNRPWRKGLLRTIRGTSCHCVRDRLHLIGAPVLVICGEEDRIVDSELTHEAVMHLPNYHFLMLPRCGHAPQIECARTVNRLVREFVLEAVFGHQPSALGQNTVNRGVLSLADSR